MLKIKNKLYTKNLTPGKTVYTEKLFDFKGEEYREWDPRKSKLGAGILKDIKDVKLKEGDVVLYLGAASGTTVSHVSDIVDNNGFVFALDFAPRVVRDLVYVAEERKNIAPMMFDANKPDEYQHLILPQIDFLFMDIAQKNQSEIFIKNVKRFLKKSAFAMVAIKARSIDVTKKPKQIYNQVRNELKQHFELVDEKNLEPFEKDHFLFLVRKLN